MDSKVNIISDLLLKHIKGELTEEEQLLLEQLKQESGETSALFTELAEKEFVNKGITAIYEAKESKTRSRQVIWQALEKKGMIEKAAAPVHRVHLLKTAWFRYAAILLLIAGAAILLYEPHPAGKLQSAQIQVPLKHDALPGSNKATLTLADGSTIMLDSATNGKLAEQGGTKIMKLNTGEIAYSAGPSTGEVLYNKISTPNGGQYQIRLPDGTKVWLNAASSITYPSSFTRSERNVTVSGEAYFEVTKNQKMPFNVKLVPVSGNEGFVVKVIGTHFNINSYSQEADMKITLLEGSIALSRTSGAEERPTLLKPGQQVQVNTSGKTTMIDNADIEQVMAWKNGFFCFNGADIQTIMRQVARWYDVEVVYENGIPAGLYRGRPSRNLTASQMLKVIEYSGVKFRIEGNKIIVNK